jgi:hypothetical protein
LIFESVAEVGLASSGGKDWGDFAVAVSARKDEWFSRLFWLIQEEI